MQGLVSYVSKVLFYVASITAKTSKGMKGFVTTVL